MFVEPAVTIFLKSTTGGLCKSTPRTVKKPIFGHFSPVWAMLYKRGERDQHPGILAEVLKPVDRGKSVLVPQAASVPPPALDMELSNMGPEVNLGPWGLGRGSTLLSSPLNDKCMDRASRISPPVVFFLGGGSGNKWGM